MSERLVAVQPEGWPRPKGYVNGMVTRGRTLYVAGQVGWNEEGVFVAKDLPGQLAQALDNVLAVVRAAGGAPEDVAKMTVYVTDLDAYRGALREVGAAWRARFGRHFPAMALVGVAGLVEREALVEVEAIAALPDPPQSTSGAAPGQAGLRPRPGGAGAAE